MAEIRFCQIPSCTALSDDLPDHLPLGVKLSVLVQYGILEVSQAQVCVSQVGVAEVGSS